MFKGTMFLMSIISNEKGDIQFMCCVLCCVLCCVCMCVRTQACVCVCAVYVWVGVWACVHILHILLALSEQQILGSCCLAFPCYWHNLTPSKSPSGQWLPHFKCIHVQAWSIAQNWSESKSSSTVRNWKESSQRKIDLHNKCFKKKDVSSYLAGSTKQNHQ